MKSSDENRRQLKLHLVFHIEIGEDHHRVSTVRVRTEFRHSDVEGNDKLGVSGDT